jgi:N6-L-threonylcarbamoyladenine synthase
MTLILGIETSCDETAAALVREDGRVLSSVVSSQVDLHRPLGGVVPEIASRAHLRLLLPAIHTALAEASTDLDGVDGIAVTRGPGLIGALLVGVQAAKSLAYAASKPVVGVHHLVGHMSAPFLVDDSEASAPAYPFVALVASGGHTSLFEVRGPGQTRRMGRTRDDAAGEALDKGAKLLGLGYPGGPAIEREASRYDGPDAEPFPRGLRRRGNLDFSFSGLKTALAERVRGLELDAPTRGALSKAYQESVVDSLVTKSLEACAAADMQRLVVCGGVASNARLGAELERRSSGASVGVHVPPARYCTDNAAMIALAGSARLAAGENEVFDLAAEPYLAMPDALS